MIVPDAADAAGGCLLSSGDTTLATRDGLAPTNPLVTTTALTAPSTACVPVTAQERARTDPTEFCGAGATCTTDLASTEFIAVPSAGPGLAASAHVHGRGEQQEHDLVQGWSVRSRLSECDQLAYRSSRLRQQQIQAELDERAAGRALAGRTRPALDGLATRELLENDAARAAAAVLPLSA